MAEEEVVVVVVVGVMAGDGVAWVAGAVEVAAVEKSVVDAGGDVKKVGKEGVGEGDTTGTGMELEEEGDMDQVIAQACTG